MNYPSSSPFHSPSSPFHSAPSGSRPRKDPAAGNGRPSVITRQPGGKAIDGKCDNCYVKASETPLKVCARCKVSRYCSRECQAAHWQTHKPWCQNNADHFAELQQADARGHSQGLPPGITYVEMDQKLEKWVKFHNALLMAATIHALALPRDIRRSHTYMLRVRIGYRPDHGDVSAKFFRVIDASVIDFETARTFGNVWVASIDQIAKLRTDSESLRRGTVAAVALECDPLAMQIVPFGSLRDLSPLVVQQRWKEILMRDVDAGKKLSRFEM